MLGAGIYILFSVPKDIQIFFPIAVLLGVLLGLGMLAQHNELVIIQASGYTGVHVALSVIKATIPLVLLTMAIGEWVVPQGEKSARNYRSQAMYDSSLLSIAQQGLWVKDCQNFVYIERVKDDNELTGVNIFTFDENRRLQLVCYAVTAKFNQEHKLWHLLHVNKFNLQNSNQITSSQINFDIWKTNLTPDNLYAMVLDPDVLSISDLNNYINYLKSSGQDASRYQFNMWSKILQPMLITVMVLIAVSFIFDPLRNVTMGVCIITGMSFGFIFYILEQIFGLLTLVYGISPIIGASLPCALFFLSALVFYKVS